MRRDRARFSLLTAAGAVTALTLAACGSGNASTTTSTTSDHAAPITVGISLPLTGPFSADGLASEHGYQLWATDVNTNGGLLGHPVRLKIVDDKSDPNVTTRQYRQLITQDHVNFTLAPFSSLLTVPAGQVTEKYHYILPAGSAGAPAVYGLHDPYMLSTNVPVQIQMVPFAQWVLSLPPSQRPKTAAYPMVADPFADPPVQKAASLLSAGGVKTVYYSHKPVTANANDANLVPIAHAVAAAHPDLVVLGTVDVPSLLTFIRTFQQDHFTPKIMIASSGPDQGTEFLHHVGPGPAEAIMVPDGWYGGMQNALSHVMVQDYIAKFGGTTSGINADVAEAYSAGEVLAAGVEGTHSLNNPTINAYLHSHVVQTVVGPQKFSPSGENTLALHQAFIFQWQNSQFVQVLPTTAAGSVKPEVIKPANWQG